MSTPTHITPELLRRFDRPGPRYTSYPTAPVWRDTFGDADYRAALARTVAADDDEPLSLYVHIPFCRERCAFCGCNVIVSKKESIAEKYLDYVDRELSMLANALNGRRRLQQLHWGGGTPTYLPPELIEHLHENISSYFHVPDDAEQSVEVDPRVTSRRQLELLRELGFNRISIGVQDLDWDVQEAIGRCQSEEETRSLFACCRELGFHSVNVDLVYGLPAQTIESWRKTLEGINELRPDRIAVYSYAYLPERLHNQRRVDARLLPPPEIKYALLAMAREAFQEAGYTAIGMDHFALPEDALAEALDAGRLSRNFMGYTVDAAKDTIGAGVSAIGEVGAAYAQNEKNLARYFRKIDANEFATACGWTMSSDDIIRNWVIRQLTCNLSLSFAALEARFGVEFDHYFAEEDTLIEPFYADGYVVRDESGLRLEGLGRVFVRNIAMTFDRYLREEQGRAAFSSTL